MEVAITSFGLGLLSVASPCVLPLYPGFLAYLSGQTELTSPARRALLGPLVLAGVLTMMLALGGVIAALAISVGRALSVVIPLADLIILGLGVALVLDRNPFTRLPQVRIPILRRPLINAFVYGLLYGPIALPCSGPLVVAVFALSLTVGEAIDKLWVFLWFGVGFGAPLLVLSVLSAGLQRRLTRIFASQRRRINLVGGVALLAVATYDLAQNWPMLLAFYA
ncbi:MAG: cytochrome c biogenesis CcdA family protein [Candidatus Limnocylindrales bacterium]